MQVGSVQVGSVQVFVQTLSNRFSISPSLWHDGSIDAQYAKNVA